LIVALLIALVTVFAAGAVVHHLADHGDTASAATHHSDGDHVDAICAVGAACGLALLLMGLMGLGFARIPPPPHARRRHRQRARGGPLPGRFVFRPLRRADLQCFLT
jgi:hypothetical protein